MIMPELPEVETIRRFLSPELSGRRILSVEVLRNKNVETPLEQFLAVLPGRKIEGISRRGKFLLFRLEGGLVLMCHLRMEGKLFVKEEGAPLEKHDLFVFHLDDGKKLIYNDTRKFGRFGLYKEEELPSSPVGKLGKEPSKISLQEFQSGLKRRKKAIKEALLDQTLTAGIGNIYADESLFRAQISPFRPASSLSDGESARLLSCIRDVLEEAIEAGGSTVKSYHPRDGESGRMQFRLLAYGKKGKPCPRCGFPLKKEKLGGRGTVYCPRCQRKAGGKIVVGVLGPIHSGKSTVSSILSENGYRVYDADKDVRALYQEKAFQKKIVKAFGEEALKEGFIDFAYLRLIFSKDASSKAKINSLVFPAIKERAAAFIKKQPINSKIVLDVPLLFQAKMDSLCDATLLVFASLKTQRERLEKEGRDAEKLLAINAGYPLEELKRKVSFVLENEGDLKALKEKLKALPLP